ncbi:MAG: sodium-dependent transporter [Lachnospiraceae bacterium]|nr:sodium-dependent transporter [Lachnospiraceae bacterium]
MNTKSNFSSRIGFVLATAGSAVGLGNLWRFPYLAAKYGGGTFLFIYLILVVTFGFSMMITEIAIGRKTGLSVIGAFQKLDKRFSFLGYLAAVVPMIIFPYYCVIGGWVIKYGVLFSSGQIAHAATDGAFNTFIEGTAEPLGYFFLFIAVTALIVVLGVEKGIEKFSKILMPLLVLLTIGIAIYGLTVDGAMAGVKYYLTPDFSKISMNAICAALSQLFYSMSIAMGILVTYGSYMSKEDDLAKSAVQVEFFDTGIAFLAALIVIPAVFAFSGGDPATLGAGPSLMFIALPKVFANMQFGSVIGTAFFILVFFAALTSSISLLETIVSIFMEKLHLSRKKACLIIFIVSLALGIPSALGYGALGSIKLLGMQFLDFFDFISNSVIMPIVAFFTCILVGHIIKPEAIRDEVNISGKFKRYAMYRVMMKYIGPVMLLVILVSSILNTFGIISL